MLARMRMSAGRWAEVVSAWEASGRSARSFADEHGVTEGSLRWWKGELARRARREPARRSPGPGRKQSRSRAVTLARVVREGEQLPPAAASAKPPVVIVVGEARILVEQDFDADVLRAVVHALSARP
jgi:hypothetical protein